MQDENREGKERRRFSQGIAQQFSYINATKRVFNINTNNIIIINTQT